MQPILVVPGISFPFFPPRPKTGVVLTERTVPGFVETHKGSYLLQKKLNGDRVIVFVRDGQVHFLNRHGKPYTFTVTNKKVLGTLPDNTLTDGEVRNKVYVPFEVVVLGGKSYAKECPNIRAEAAREVTLTTLKQPYDFDVTQDYLEGLRKNHPVWEGVVRKRLGSAYVPLGSDTQTTPQWFKNKWLGVI